MFKKTYMILPLAVLLAAGCAPKPAAIQPQNQPALVPTQQQQSVVNSQPNGTVSPRGNIATTNPPAQPATTPQVQDCGLMNVKLEIDNQPVQQDPLTIKAFTCLTKALLNCSLATVKSTNDFVDSTVYLRVDGSDGLNCKLKQKRVYNNGAASHVTLCKISQKDITDSQQGASANFFQVFSFSTMSAIGIADEVVYGENQDMGIPKGWNCSKSTW